MKKYAIAFAGLTLAAGSAYAQPADLPGAGPDLSPEAAAPADPVIGDQTLPAEAALPPAGADAGLGVQVTDQEVDSFAEATIRVQAIDADTTLDDQEKNTQMAQAVTESGLDPARYNEIGRAAMTDDELRSKVQTAMARHAGHTDG
jgi:hypothetical protein